MQDGQMGLSGSGVATGGINWGRNEDEYGNCMGRGEQGPTGESVAATRSHLRRQMYIDGSERCGFGPSGACPTSWLIHRDPGVYITNICLFLSPARLLVFNNIIQLGDHVGWGREYVM